MTYNKPTKTGGRVNEAMGNVKAATGKVFGNEELRAKGNLQHAKGEAEVDAAKAKANTEAAGYGAKGHVKEAVGAVTGNETLRQEGHVDRAHGAAHGDLYG